MNNRKIGTIILIIAMIIVAISVLFTNNLARSLQHEEEKNMAMWAEATRQLVIADDDADIDFVTAIIEGNTTIPAYICDKDGNIIGSRNIDCSAELDNKKLITENHHGPIEIKIPDEPSMYIYWDDSHLLSLLRFVPYAQFALILIFITISIVMMMAMHRGEQNMLWVGLSKETAHQLGTPISSLNAWQQILLEKYPDDEYVLLMKKDIDRLQMIADRFQKIGSEADLVETDIVPIIENAVTYMRARISSKITIDDQAIKGVQRIVAVNAPLLQWVIENIIKNSVDAISGNGTITIQIHENEKEIMMDITDNGNGMEKQIQRKIFNAGYTTKQRGWGLGLPLAKRIIEQYHRGKLLLKYSQPGHGSTFRIILKKAVNS